MAVMVMVMIMSLWRWDFRPFSFISLIIYFLSSRALFILRDHIVRFSGQNTEYIPCRFFIRYHLIMSHDRCHVFHALTHGYKAKTHFIWLNSCRKAHANVRRIQIMEIKCTLKATPTAASNSKQPDKLSGGWQRPLHECLKLNLSNNRFLLLRSKTSFCYFSLDFFPCAIFVCRFASFFFPFPFRLLLWLSCECRARQHQKNVVYMTMKSALGIWSSFYGKNVKISSEWFRICFLNLNYSILACCLWVTGVTVCGCGMAYGMAWRWYGTHGYTDYRYSKMILPNENFALIFNCNFCAQLYRTKLFQHI